MQHEAFLRCQNNLDEKECIVIFDFKENISLQQGKLETVHNFYEKEHISVLKIKIIKDLK